MLLLPLPVLAYVSMIAVATLDCQTHHSNVRREGEPASGADVEIVHGVQRSQVHDDRHMLHRKEPASDRFNVQRTYSKINKAHQYDAPGLSKPGFQRIGNPAGNVRQNFFMTANPFGNNDSSSGGRSSSSSEINKPRQKEMPTKRLIEQPKKEQPLKEQPLKEQPLVYQTKQTARDQRHKRQSSSKEIIGWTVKNQLSYKVVPSASWTEAQQLCRSMNSFLADFMIKSEEDDMYDFLISLGVSRVWIGLNNRDVKDKWVWDSGHPATYVNWNNGEPNNTNDGENCAGVYAHRRAGFTYFSCSLRLSGLCQRRGSECGDTLLGSGVIQSQDFPTVYSSNPKCTFTVQAAPGAVGILLQIQRASVNSGLNNVLISSKLGVQLTLSGKEEPLNITVDSPATIVYGTRPYLIAAGYTITFSSVTSSNELCGTGWTWKRGSCYRLTPNPVTWINAQQECISMNGFLADVGNFMEEVDVYEFVDINAAALNSVWIGFNYREVGNQRVRSSGSAVNRAVECAQLFTLYRHGIRGVSCSTELRGVCKKIGRTCGATVTGSGIVQSPGFPANYASNLDCSWTIQAETWASRILMQVLYFSTEACCDHVKVSSTSGFQLSLSGVQKSFNITLGASATVSFNTDYSGESTGFTIAFTSLL